jgi:esterase/lipase superfamily enzyme
MHAGRQHTHPFKKSLAGGYEALLFVHGFNSSLENVLGLLGQMLALGSFPGEIVPVIFGWPCTKGALYPFVRSPLSYFSLV